MIADSCLVGSQDEQGPVATQADISSLHGTEEALPPYGLLADAHLLLWSPEDTEHNKSTSSSSEPFIS